jgi:hypothetical protein
MTNLSFFDCQLFEYLESIIESLSYFHTVDDLIWSKEWKQFFWQDII